MSCPVCKNPLDVQGDFYFCDTAGCEVFPGLDDLEVLTIRLQLLVGIEPDPNSCAWMWLAFVNARSEEDWGEA